MFYSKSKLHGHSGPVNLATTLMLVTLCFEMIASKEFKVLMTGFEPFGNPLPKTNPSWEAIKYLDGQTLNHGTDSFVFNCQRIPVVYSKVENIIPELYKRDSYDIVIHVGQGIKNVIKIESQAKAFAYTFKDNDGVFPKDYYVPHKYIPISSNPQNYTRYTSVDTQSLADYLVHQVGYDWVKYSDDAGKYLCEYTLFCSLSESDQLQSNRPELNKRTVIFVHVPNPDRKLTLDKITDTIKTITFSLSQFSK